MTKKGLGKYNLVGIALLNENVRPSSLRISAIYAAVSI